MDTIEKKKKYDPKRARNLIVRHPRFKEISQMIKECFEDTYESGEPSCLALEGTMGVGKTTLVKDYAKAKRVWREYKQGQKVRNVLYVSTPSPATINKLSQKMLESLGDPMPNARSRQDPTARLISHLKACEVKLVILDEFQHMINSPTNYRLRTVSDWLKGVIKEVGIPFVVVGIQGEVSQVLDFNPQLGRLFVPHVLEPFMFDPKDKNTIEEFNKFIRSIESGLDFWICKEIDRVDLLHRIYLGTNGITSFIVKLLKHAAKKADAEGYDCIKLSHFAYSYKRWIAKKVKKNGDDKLFENVPLSVNEANTPLKSSKQGNKRRKKREKASQVFTT